MGSRRPRAPPSRRPDAAVKKRVRPARRADRWTTVTSVVRDVPPREARHVTSGAPRQLRCKHCEREFTPPPRARRGPNPKYCGRTCRQRAYELRAVLPDYERLRREVVRLRRENRRLYTELDKLGWRPPLE